MDESLQAKLARSNINIAGINNTHILFEFPYHPKPGEVKWCKSYILKGTDTIEQSVEKIPALVLSLRKTLER